MRSSATKRSKEVRSALQCVSVIGLVLSLLVCIALGAVRSKLKVRRGASEDIVLMIDRLRCQSSLATFGGAPMIASDNVKVSNVLHEWNETAGGSAGELPTFVC